MVNKSAEGDAWFIKIEVADASELESEELLDEAAYKALIE